MRTRALLPLLALGLGLGALAATPAPAADEAEKPDADKIAKLVTQLGSDDFDDREKATQELDAIGEPALDALRQALKNSDEEIHKRAQLLVGKIEKRMESANALTPRRVHLVYKDTPLPEALDDFKKQSGYDLTLNDPENKLKDRKISLDTGDVTFWQALDQFCDKAGVKEADSLTLPIGPVPPVGTPVTPLIPTPPVNPPTPAPPPLIPPAPKKDGGAAAPPPAPAQAAVLVAGQAAQPAPNPPPAAPPIIFQPGIVIGGPAVPPLIGAPGSPNDVTLMDGKPDVLPTDASSAVRVQALPKAYPFGPAADGEFLLALRLSLEPKMQWQSLDKVTITKAVDDQKQELTQTTGDANPPGVGALPGGLAPATVPAPIIGLNSAGIYQTAAVHLKKGEKASKSLAELSGTIRAHVLGEAKAVITADEILKAGGKSFKGGENGELKIAEVAKTDAGEVRIRLELQAPTDIVPAGDPNANPLPQPIPRRNLRNNRGAPQPAQPNPQPGGAPTVGAGQAAAPGGPAVAPGGVVIGIAAAPAGVMIGPGVWNPQGAAGLSLLDDMGEVVPQKGLQIQFVSTAGPNGVVTTQQQIVMTFQLDKGQNPAKLVYSGRKALSVDVPFTLKNVPLP